MANAVVLGDFLRETLFRRTHIRIWELNTLTYTETQTVGGANRASSGKEEDFEASGNEGQTYFFSVFVSLYQSLVIL